MEGEREKGTSTEFHIWEWFGKKLVECVKTNDCIWNLKGLDEDNNNNKMMKKYGANMADCEDREVYMCVYVDQQVLCLDLSVCLCVNGMRVCVRFEIQIILTENFLITHYTTSNLIWVICKAKQNVHTHTCRGREREAERKKVSNYLYFWTETIV